MAELNFKAPEHSDRDWAVKLLPELTFILYECNLEVKHDLCVFSRRI